MLSSLQQKASAATHRPLLPLLARIERPTEFLDLEARVAVLSEAFQQRARGVQVVFVVLLLSGIMPTVLA